MRRTSDADVAIVAASAYLPGEPVDNATMAQIFGIRADWIDAFIGTKTRHFATDLHSGVVVDDLAGLCTHAAESALDAAPLGREELDLLVLSTATPDHLMPSTANLVADRLGLNDLATYQLQAGCAGAYQAIDVAATALDGGRFRNALVIGGDVCNKYLDFGRDLSKLRASELINLALFGDGAGAIVLSRDGRRGIGIRHRFQRCVGRGRLPGQTLNWFGTAQAALGAQSAAEDYKAIELHVPTLGREVLAELMQATHWEVDSIEHHLPPQLGGHMSDRITRELGFPIHRAINCVAETGNNGNALPFVQLARLFERVRCGERAFAIAVESSKWVKAGMALEGIEHE